MYKYLSVLLLASMMQLSASDEVATTNVVDGKVYVRPRSVRMMKKGILVRTQDGHFFAPSVAKDETGLYVNQADLVAAPEMARALSKRGRGCGCKKNRALVDGQAAVQTRKHHGRKHHHHNWKNKKSASTSKKEASTPVVVDVTQ